MIAWAREVLADPSTVVLDSETTGLGDYAEVVELALLGVDGRVHFDSRLKPALARMEPGASAVNGLTDSMLWNVPRLADVWPRLEPVLCRSRIVVYNAAFDQRLLLQSVRANRLPSYHGYLHREWECAMLQYAAFWYVSGESSFSWRRWQKLDDACAQMGVYLNVRAHSALGDCQRTLSLLRALADLA